MSLEMSNRGGVSKYWTTWTRPAATGVRHHRRRVVFALSLAANEHIDHAGQFAGIGGIELSGHAGRAYRQATLAARRRGNRHPRLRGEGLHAEERRRGRRRHVSLLHT